MNGTTFGVIVDTRPLERISQILTAELPHIPAATKLALEHIHNKAMDNLYSQNLKWGSSVVNEEQSIRESAVIDEFAGTLTYTSPHAQLIEFGGNYIYERDPSLGPMPIGKQEGHTEFFGYKVVGVFPGRYFLTSAFATEGDAVRQIYERYVNNIIRKI